MSSDDGIYILVTDGESRVKHLQGIDAIYSGVTEDGEWNEEAVRRMFSGSEIFTKDINSARRFANERCHARYAPTEYGVVELDHSERRFPA